MPDDRDHTRQGKHRSHARGVPIVTPTEQSPSSPVLVADSVDVSTRLSDFGEDAPITGVHSGEELARARAARPTDQRIGRLEEKHDRLDRIVGDIRADVSETKGKVSLLPKLIDESLRAVNDMRAREHVTFTAQVDVDRAKTVATIEDAADATRARRERVTKIVGGVIALLSSGALLHWLVGKL
jgi:hypothetical protein